MRQIHAPHPFIVADIPGYDYERAPSDMAARMKIIPPRQRDPAWGYHGQAQAEYERVQGDINRVLENICRKTGAVFVPAHLALKEGAGYISFVTRPDGAIPLYSDANHLTRAGSLRVARFILTFPSPPASRPGASP